MRLILILVASLAQPFMPRVLASAMNTVSAPPRELRRQHLGRAKAGAGVAGALAA